MFRRNSSPEKPEKRSSSSCHNSRESTQREFLSLDSIASHRFYYGNLEDKGQKRPLTPTLPPSPRETDKDSDVLLTCCRDSRFREGPHLPTVSLLTGQALEQSLECHLFTGVP